MIKQNSHDFYVSRTIKILKQNGYKYTTKRETILSYFFNENRYLSARAVYDKIKEQFPGISYDTIYRNLYLFAEMGILEENEMNGEKIFRIHCGYHEDEDHDHHHHHFICQNCGQTISLDVCPMDWVGHELDDCVVISHRFEVFGYCKDCATFFKQAESKDESTCGK